ncbi:MAG: hypothetical protein AAFP02_00370, partial [Bacteroidota bacterium]
MQTPNIAFRFYMARREVYHNDRLQKVSYWEEIEEEEGDSFGFLLKQRIEKFTLNSESTTWLFSKNLAADLTIDIAIWDNHSLNDAVAFERLLTESNLRAITNSTSRRFTKHFTPNPMISIGIDNLMELGEEGSKSIAEPQKSLVDNLHRRVDPRFRVLDSSIWNRYISLAPNQSFQTKWEELLQDIVSYFQNGLYETVIAQEYLEFQCRKLQQSYLKNYPGGHAKRVTPFRFHSESKMRQLAEIKRTELLQSGPKCWSCLLVDDYANRPLRSMGESAKEAQNAISISTKLAWIDSLINRPGEAKLLTFLNPTESWERNQKPKNTKYTGYLDYFFHLLTENAESQRPDIIILDYFFGIEERDPEQQYGHKFIKKLKDYYHSPSGGKSNHSLAFGKYWIFPISAFEHAFRSHLRLMGEGTIQ